MQRQTENRRREKITVALFVLVLGSLSVKAYMFDLGRLSLIAEERAHEVKRLQADDIRLSAMLTALRTEIKALQTDSEQTSVLARTTLGMVISDEVVYQLSGQQTHE